MSGRLIVKSRLPGPQSLPAWAAAQNSILPSASHNILGSLAYPVVLSCDPVFTNNSNSLSWVSPFGHGSVKSFWRYVSNHERKFLPYNYLTSGRDFPLGRTSSGEATPESNSCTIWLRASSKLIWFHLISPSRAKAGACQSTTRVTCRDGEM